MNITEYSRHWYTTREEHCRPNTQNGYYNLIEHHTIPRMNQISLSELTEEEIQILLLRLHLFISAQLVRLFRIFHPIFLSPTVHRKNDKFLPPILPTSLLCSEGSDPITE